MDVLESEEMEEVMEALARAAIILLDLGPRLDAFNEMASVVSSAEFVATTGNFRMSQGADRWVPIGQAGATLRDQFAPGYEAWKARRAHMESEGGEEDNED